MRTSLQSLEVRWFQLACLAALLGGLSARAESPEGGSPSLTLAPSALTTSAGVYLSQVLKEAPPGMNDVLLSPAPALNQALSLTRAQLAEAAARHDSTLVLTNWSGAEQVKVTRRMRRLEEAELKGWLTAALQRDQVRDRGELELHLGRPWAAVLVPDETLTVRILDLPTAGVTSSFILRFELLSEKELVGSWQVPLQARIWREVWVARSAQPRGRLLRQADLATDRRDLLVARDALTALDLNDSSLELAEYLPPGAVVTIRSLRMRPIVRRGKLMEAVVEEGALVITVKVEALEDGLPGQVIRVRNANSKREFHAKVQNEETVSVSL